MVGPVRRAYCRDVGPDMSEGLSLGHVRNGQYCPRAMRLLVARCEVLYTGRLSTALPGATRLLMFKDDGSFLVHDDVGGYKLLNWIRTDFRPPD